ncbi:MAG: single-stranded-DNA-specific exonuclease RecJ [Ruminococcaceae bacterium]|nr:single-stranded-DNA-specific exonuclease RecJ [Oscillospiraceae bacterium]
MKEIKRERVWIDRYTFGEEEQDRSLREMAQKMGVSELFAVLLWNRGLRSATDAERFLRLEQGDFHDPYLFADMEAAVERIFSALESNESITVYGDYDVDGVTSVTVLYLYLKELGGRVDFRIPKREGEGYGVSCRAVEELAQNGTSLIITVDTGITAAEEVAYAKTLGVDFVITDHHECRAELPNACAVVNPHRPDCPYPFKELAGVGVVFKVICACEMRRCRQSGEPILDGIRRICRTYADLTAVGTIADVMPVVDENRLIVSLGLKLMEHTERSGLSALMDAAFSKKKAEDGKKTAVTSGMIGFGIAPRINAAGRISDAAIAVRLLLEQDAEKARLAAEELCEINRHRQTEENRIVCEAYAKIEDMVESNEDRVIVLDSDNWHPGVIGIVSSRITERYGLPSILISFDRASKQPDPMDVGKGSGRSIKGMNLVEALAACEDCLVKYGGHELAAGLSVRRGELEEFRTRINAYARQVLSEDVLQIRMEADCALRMSDVTLRFAQELTMLEPFGVGNSTPVFSMRDVTVKRITHIGGGKHTRLLVEREGVTVNALYFGMGEGALGFEAGDLIDILFQVDINDYKNVRSVQLILQDARPAEGYSKELAEQKARYETICGGAPFAAAEDVIPNREDCARVYKLLRREYRAEHNLIELKGLLKQVNAFEEEPAINSIKLRYILRILHELKLCEIIELGEELYRFAVTSVTDKTSIDRSALLQKLKSQCTDRTN